MPLACMESRVSEKEHKPTQFIRRGFKLSLLVTLSCINICINCKVNLYTLT